MRSITGEVENIFVLNFLQKKCGGSGIFFDAVFPSLADHVLLLFVTLLSLAAIIIYFSEQKYVQYVYQIKYEKLPLSKLHDYNVFLVIPGYSLPQKDALRTWRFLCQPWKDDSANIEALSAAN